MLVAASPFKLYWLANMSQQMRWEILDLAVRWQHLLVAYNTLQTTAICGRDYGALA